MFKLSLFRDNTVYSTPENECWECVSPTDIKIVEQKKNKKLLKEAQTMWKNILARIMLDKIG